MECLKAKTKVMTPANHKGHRQNNEPIKIKQEAITCG